MSGQPQEVQRTDRESALLRWAIENQQGDERKMSMEESKEFIQNLDPKWMEALLGSADSDTDKMKRLVGELKKDDLPDEARKNVLEELTFLCELTHNANVLHKVGGLVPTTDALSSSSQDVRRNAAQLIGTCVPNNPVFQKQLLEVEAFPKLVPCLKTDDTKLLKKTLLCISGFVRNFPAALHTFLDSPEALPAVVEALKSTDLPVARRAAFFVVYLLHNKTVAGMSSKQFHKAGGLDAILHAARSEDADLREKALEALKEYAGRGKEERNALRELKATDVLESLSWGAQQEEEDSHPPASRQVAQDLKSLLSKPDQPLMISM